MDASNGILDEASDMHDPEGTAVTAVINPYALAELVTGRKINWKEVDDVPGLLEDVLQTPYEELFDPVFEGPLYTGLKINPASQSIELTRSPLLDLQTEAKEMSDLEIGPGTINKVGDLKDRFGYDKVADIEVNSAEIVGQKYLQLTIPLPEAQRLKYRSSVLNKDIVQTISVDPNKGANKDDWYPPYGSWSDPGRFFNEAAEFFDPIQGSVANCYYIAALSSVAWANPNRICHMTRATGTDQQRFTNMIRFYKIDTNTVDKEIEVTDAVPVTSSGSIIYCRSRESGEIWPAVYEKAFAKYKTGTTGDRPDITKTGWGDCVWATSLLNGGKRYYYYTSNRSADTLYSLVQANSLGRHTFNPMTAWTYSSGAARDRGINYQDANIVASHAYSVLGWVYRNKRKYIIVRNPWGHTEGTRSTIGGTVMLYDISWWRPINLTDIDGVFAIEASAFKLYFAGLGVAK